MTPPVLLGAAVVFWGWETGLLLPAAVLAVLLEGARAVAWRLDFSRRDFHRISDLERVLVDPLPRKLGSRRALDHPLLGRSVGVFHLDVEE